MIRLIVVVLIIALQSCGKEVFYEKNIPIENEAWSQTDTVKVTLDIDDIDQEFDLFINIRNNKTYAYMNLFMFLDIEAPSGEVWHDTLKFDLADQKGMWRSEDVSESYVMSSFRAYSGYHFPEKGTYTFRLNHGLYDEPLKGISDIGIKLKIVD